MKNNEKVVLAAVQQSSSAIQFASRKIQDNEDIVVVAIQRGLRLKDVSQNMKNNEKVCLAAVVRAGDNLKYASDEMKNNEKVVLAAVQQSSSAYQYASEKMQNDEKFILLAIQLGCLSLQNLSEEMKNNAKVVAAAVRENRSSFLYASEEMKDRINTYKWEFRCNVKEAARISAEARVVQVSVTQPNCGASSPSSGSAQAVVVTCCSLGGDELGIITLESQHNSKDVRRLIATCLGVQEPRALRIVLPSGEWLRDDDMQTPFHKLFGLNKHISPAHDQSSAAVNSCAHQPELCSCVEHVGVKMDGEFHCKECRQNFTSDKALQSHWKFIHGPNRHQEE